jgi:hypothetical protein
MARKIVADTDVSGTTSKIARERAERQMNGKPKEGEKSAPPKILAAEGHNGPKPKELQDMYLEAKELRGKIESANARYRKFLATCKERGLQPAVITEMMRFEKQDPDEAKAFWRQFRKLHEATDQEIQMDLFTGGGGPVSVSRQAEVFDLGFKCGLRGGDHSESQWDAGTEWGQIWLAGHAQGVTQAARNAFDRPQQPAATDDPPPPTTH